MRKKLIIAASVVAIGAIAAFNVSMNSQSGNLSDLALANVEALSGGEAPVYDCPGGWKICLEINFSEWFFKK
ncbi:MAG: NVEALA domain-containing protein [Prevotellaceae bacterium]|jgi:hypothetical protein|nr:NVEALA domain-containing protein [Prevotellaceae bacterium]